MYTLGCANCQTMGALPAIAPLASLLTTSLNQFLSTFGLNSSDPVKDQERIERIKATYAQAMTGDAGAIQCLRDMAQGVSSGPNDPRSCAVGSTVAATFAKSVWAEYQARVAAGNIGAGLLAQSPLPSTVLQTAINYAPWIIGGIIAISLLKKSRGR